MSIPMDAGRSAFANTNIRLEEASGDSCAMHKYMNLFASIIVKFDLLCLFSVVFESPRSRHALSSPTIFFVRQIDGVCRCRSERKAFPVVHGTRDPPSAEQKQCHEMNRIKNDKIHTLMPWQRCITAQTVSNRLYLQIICRIKFYEGKEISHVVRS